MKALARDLQKLGLSEKEALVYLSSLELGPSPVQTISRKADVNRATTYVMIESLVQHGLMSSFQKGKKMLYTAEKPDRLHRIVHKERDLVNEKEETIKRILPDLDAVCVAAGERPQVSFYEGEEGLEAMREIIFSSNAKELDDFVSMDDLSHLLPEEHWKKHNLRLKKNKITGRVIFSSESDYHPPEEGKETWKYKRIPKKQFPMHGELTVFGNKVAMISLKGKLVGVVIESKEMATMVRSMFELAWIQAENYKKSP